MRRTLPYLVVAILLGYGVAATLGAIQLITAHPHGLQQAAGTVLIAGLALLLGILAATGRKLGLLAEIALILLP